jgi:hypothetical protein
MRARSWAVLAVAAAIATPAAAEAARTLSYQGFTSQGHELSFKRTGKGVISMKIEVRANCVNDQGQNQGDYDFTLRALDRNADPVRRGHFTVRLPGDQKTPDATIKGAFNSHGSARGTITASGRVTTPSDLGNCTSGTVRWTAAP